jgi:hypothetical protein
MARRKGSYGLVDDDSGREATTAAALDLRTDLTRGVRRRFSDRCRAAAYTAISFQVPLTLYGELRTTYGHFRLQSQPLGKDGRPP